MYTRSYFPDENKITVPENYDGNAFSEDSQREEAPRITPRAAIAQETKISPRDEAVFIPTSADEVEDEKPAQKSENEGGGFLSSVFKKLPFSGLFPAKMGGIFKDGGFRIGSEEILIIAVALFLFFSKEGDRECAFMLLALLFIG